METQRIAQIQHQQSEVNEQKHESDRIRHFRHAQENRGRRQLADRGGQEQSGRHAVEQSVPGDDAVPPRHFGHRRIRIAALAPWFLLGGLARACCDLESACIQGFKRNSTASSTAIAAKPPATERT